MSSISKLIAQLDKEDELWEKDTEEHFENQRKKYQDMFERIKTIKANAEKCMDNITKGMDKLVDNQHTIEKALKQTENLDGLPISPEQQENAIDLVNKITKFMNNTELITSPSPISPEQIQTDVASYTASVAQDLKDCKTELCKLEALYHKTHLLNWLIANSDKETEESQHKSQLHPIPENE